MMGGLFLNRVWGVVPYYIISSAILPYMYAIQLASILQNSFACPTLHYLFRQPAKRARSPTPPNTTRENKMSTDILTTMSTQLAELNTVLETLLHRATENLTRTERAEHQWEIAFAYHSLVFSKTSYKNSVMRRRMRN